MLPPLEDITLKRASKQSDSECLEYVGDSFLQYQISVRISFQKLVRKNLNEIRTSIVRTTMKKPKKRALVAMYMPSHFKQLPGLHPTTS